MSRRKKLLRHWRRARPYSQQKKIALEKVKSRRDIMRYLMGEVQLNAGKALNLRMTGCKYHYVERSRGDNIRYFETLLKGNYIICNELKYANEEPWDVTTHELFRVPNKALREYIDKYRAASPELEWDYRENHAALNQLRKIERMLENA